MDQECCPSVESQQRFIPALQALMRANVRSFVSMEIEEEDDTFKMGEIEFALLLGF